MPQLEPFPTPQIVVIELPEDVPAVVEKIRQEPTAVALDLETTGLDPRTEEIRLIQLAFSSNAELPVYVLDCFALGDIALEPLFEALMDEEGPVLVGHNFQFDCGFLFHRGVEIAPHRTACTLVTERVMVAGMKEARLRGKKGPVVFADLEDGDDPSFVKLPCGLADVAARRLKLHLPKDEQASNWSSPELSRAQLTYAANDVVATKAIYRLQQAELRFDKGLAATAELENRLIGTTVWLQACGMPVDTAYAAELLALLEAQQVEQQAAFLQQLDTSLAEAGAKRLPRDLFGEIDASAVNLNHSPSLLKWFQLLGLKLSSLDKNEILLSEIDHPSLTAFTTYRVTVSLLRYITALLKSVRSDGRIYGQFNQMGADTGRILSKSPNLQNLPRDPRFRRLIAAPEGWKIIGADYSQIESRLMALISGDKNLLKIFRDGLDVYKATAALTSGKDISAITKEDRQSGKLLVLSLQYGMGSKKLKRTAFTNFGLRMTEEEAASARQAFFRAYPGIQALHRRVADDLEAAQAKGQAWLDFRTLRGRRRWVQAGELATAVNAPIQGLGVDILKVAMAELGQALWDAGCHQTKFIACVHDELLLEAPDEEVERASAVLERVMNEAAVPFMGEITAGAEAIAGQSWADAKG